ncbi:MAG: carboxypeptidase regulatory-like domain-containing protein [bacterium]|nr:carboxypeptidase regulatory-like domain-containing protein [bacterium]
MKNLRCVLALALGMMPLLAQALIVIVGLTTCGYADNTGTGTATAGIYIMQTKWGGSGSGDGQFNYPHGVAVDGSGNVFVVDYYNYRIQKFTADGTFITKWGSYGSGDGQFSNPYGVAVDSSGNVFVADYYNHRIQKFTADGTFITKWGSEGSGDGQFYYPHGVAVDGYGNVFVADYNNYRIQKFKPYPAGWLSGKVTSSVDNKAMNGAMVEVFNNEAVRVATTTDTNGNYCLFVPAGSCTVRVTAIGYGMLEHIVMVVENATTTVNSSLIAGGITGERLTLYNNLFDPTKNEGVIIKYELTENAEVSIIIYDFRGNLIRTLVNGYQSTGVYTETWHGKNDDGAIVASGTYLIQIKAGGFKETKKVVVVE